MNSNYALFIYKLPTEHLKQVRNNIFWIVSNGYTEIKIVREWARACLCLVSCICSKGNVYKKREQFHYIKHYVTNDNIKQWLDYDIAIHGGKASIICSMYLCTYSVIPDYQLSVK